MTEDKLYPARIAQLTAIVGFTYSLLATIGFHLVSEQAKLGFSVLYILPATFLLCPLELLILLFTIQSWNRWDNLRHRNIIFLCSSAVLLLLGGQMIFGFGFSNL